MGVGGTRTTKWAGTETLNALTQCQQCPTPRNEKHPQKGALS